MIRPTSLALALALLGPVLAPQAARAQGAGADAVSLALAPTMALEAPVALPSPEALYTAVPATQPDFLEPPAALSPDQRFAIQGAPNFRKVASLDPDDPNFRLSRKVGQMLVVRDKKVAGTCTGSLVGPSLFLTNHHCVVDRDSGRVNSAENLFVLMEHLEQGKLGPKESISPVAMLVKADFLLDYALLLLAKPLGERYGFVRLETDPERIAAVREVKIVQHPRGRSKEIVLEDTRMVKQTPVVMHYLADTEPGSSGAPVFDLGGDRLVGLHHAGARDKYNEGLVMALIARDLAFYLPREERATPSADASPAAARPAAQPATAAQPAPRDTLTIRPSVVPAAPAGTAADTREDRSREGRAGGLGDGLDRGSQSLDLR